LNGSKKYEFRKWRLPDKVKYVYIYSSGIEKKIVGYFEVSKIHRDTPKNIWDKFKYKSGITKEEYSEYIKLGNYDILYAIEIENVYEYKKYLNLHELCSTLKPPQKFKYLDKQYIDLLKNYMESQ